MSTTAVERQGSGEPARGTIRDPEQHLSVVQEFAGVGIWEWDLPAGVVRWSDQLFDIFGLSPRAFVPTPAGYLDRVHADDRERVRQVIEQACRAGGTFAFEERIHRPDGSIRILRTRGEALRSDDGAVVRLRGACLDVTESRQVEEALRASEESYRLLFELASDAMFVHDIDTGAILDANREGCELLGCSLGELRQAGLRRLSPGEAPYDEEHAGAKIRKAAAGVPQRFEWLIRQPSGERVWVEVKLHRVTIGGRSRVLASVRDITERKATESELRRTRDELEQRVAERTSELTAEIAERREAERALQLREEHFRLLIENSSDVATILDPKGINRYQSPSIERVLGYTPDELMGTSAFERIHVDDRERAREALVRMAQNPGSTVTAEFRYRHKNGTWRMLEASGRTLLPDSAAGGIIVNSRDITDRKRVEDQLRFQKTLLEAQGEASIDGILMVSPTGEILSFNRRFAELWRIPTDVLEARSDERTLQHVMHTVTDPASFMERIRYLYEHPDEESRDEIRLRDGRVLDRYSGPVRSAAGETYGRIWLFRDMTERRDAEAALRRSEQRFRSVVENSSDLVTLMDREGWIQYQSPAVERTFGYQQEELVGRNCFELVHPEDVPDVAERLSEVAACPGESRSAGFRFRHKDGHWVHVEAVGTTLSPSDADEGVIVNTRDITERKETELRLQETTRFLENLIASSPGVIFRGSGETFETTYISPNAETVLGYSAERFLAEPRLWVERTHPDDREEVTEKLLRAVQAGERQMTYEYRFRHSDGGYRCLLASVRFQHDAGAGVAEVLGYTLDVSPLKEAEAALRAAKEEAEAAREVAEEANRAKSEFLSRMSHELRTPMNSILGFAQLLAKRDLPGDQVRAVDHIVKAGKHLLNLINEVLDIARIEANRHSLSLEPVHVATLLDEALSMIRPTVAQHDCHLDDRIPPDADRYIRADRQRLTQVVLNLLSNAAKFNRPDGSISLVCRVEGDGSAADRLSIGVRDTGVGIPAERMDELFVPFSRLEADEAGIEGTGLGLALSRRLVEAMGGQMRVESVERQGSTFWIELPLTTSPLVRLAGAHGDAQEGERIGPEADPRPPATVLYIEDNLANLSLVETIFADRPEIRLLPALQGQLGLELAREHAPDLILLDLHLPDTPGEQVLRMLRADPRTRGIPVVVISADATQRQIDRLRAAGAEEYLTKPLDIDRFHSVVDGLLDAREPRP